MAAPTARALPLATASPWGLPLVKPLLALLLAVSLALGASGCNAMAAGLNTFQSPDGRYAFLYPTGWSRVQVNGGPQVVFHDLINSDETLSLVISEVNSTNELESLGSAVAVGENWAASSSPPRAAVAKPSSLGRPNASRAAGLSTTSNTAFTWPIAPATSWRPWWWIGVVYIPWLPAPTRPAGPRSSPCSSR
jgi:hypothetical protein